MGLLIDLDAERRKRRPAPARVGMGDLNASACAPALWTGTSLGSAAGIYEQPGGTFRILSAHPVQQLPS